MNLKKALLPLVLSAAVALPLQASAMTHSISTDLVRLVDNNMDNGMFNLYWQGSLSRNTAIRAGYSTGDDLSIVDVTFKGYIDRYHQGAFYEAGLTWWDGDRDDDIGFMAALGYERTLAPHFVLGGSVQVVAGISEEVAQRAETPFFLPSLYILFAF
ncbi:hypothetical protein [Marinospirillum sp.]|uniref:hypothetical protein n=1 Tax=Marinospirillum sp. TaxID=2183934 RepID=UPI003A8C0914